MPVNDCTLSLRLGFFFFFFLALVMGGLSGHGMPCFVCGSVGVWERAAGYGTCADLPSLALFFFFLFSFVVIGTGVVFFQISLEQPKGLILRWGLGPIK